MAARSDLHVRLGLSWGAVLPGTGINKHWDPICIFNLDKYNGLPDPRFIPLQFIITKDARMFCRKHTSLPHSPC